MYFFPREIPAVRLGLWFVLGIIASSYYSNINYTQALIGCVILLLAVLTINGFKHALLKGLLISLLIFSIGFARNSIEETYLPSHHFTQLDFTNGSIIGVLKEDLVSKNKYRTTLSVEHVSKDQNQFNESTGNLLVYFEKTDLSKSLKAGDRIQFHSKILDIRPNGNPYSFDFKNYLHNRSIDHQSFLKPDDWKLLSHKNLHPLQNLTQNIRQEFLLILKKYIHGTEEKAISAALVLGYKNLLTEEVYDAYTDTGSVHVLAVSGLHLGILTGMLIWLFSFFKTNSPVIELLKMTFIIISIWMFALITGSAPAVLRAATMFTLFIIGKNLFKDINTYNILFASAILLLLYDPFLLFQASFQFSYLALTSILFFQPKLSVWWIPKNKAIRFIWNLAVLALAAQILVFPITIYYFHKFPLYFALSGIVAVPFAGIILWLSVLVFASEFLLPVLNLALGPILNFVLGLFLKLIIMIQQLPFCSLDGILITYPQMIIIYACLLLMMSWYSFKIRKMIFPTLILFLSFMIHSSFTKVKNIQQKELIVYDVSGALLVDIFIGQTAFTYRDSSISESSVDFAASNYRLYHQINEHHEFHEAPFKNSHLSFNQGYITTHKKNLILLNQDTPIPDTEPIHVDYLIIGKVSKEKLAEANEKVIAQKTILSRSIPYWEKEAYLKILNNSEVYQIQDQGAYIESL